MENLSRENSEKKIKRLSHPDESLGEDYRPTQQGSSDYDRNRDKFKDQKEGAEYRKQQLNGEEKEVDSSAKKGSSDEASYYKDEQFELGGVEYSKQVPPGSPERTPVKEPDKSEQKPKGDPIPPEKKKPRL